MTVVIVQARLDSTRLPGKALLPLDGEPLISRVMAALKAVKADGYALACPEECAETFSRLAEKNGFRVIPGSKYDVLSRYGTAARAFRADRIIRATGDNPFVFADAADAINAEAEAFGADYAGYAGLPYGAGVESIAAEALFRAEREAVLPDEREHVCPYLYGHGEWFLLHRPLAPARWRRPHIRVTVDTDDDYKRATRLWEKLKMSGLHKNPSGEAIIAAAEGLS